MYDNTMGNDDLNHNIAEKGDGIVSTAQDNSGCRVRADAALW